MRSNFLNRLLYSLILCTASLNSLAGSLSTSATELKNIPPIGEAIQSEALTLLSLNLAHGRKDGPNQIFLSTNTIRSNLQDIATLLTKVNADVVALQEADGPSAWSGKFDHVAYLSESAGYDWNIRSDHAKGNLINFGTGLLSTVPFQEIISHDFPKSPPTLRKGFTLGKIGWQPDKNKPPLAVDILSVHLDFSRKSVREQQISDIINVLENRTYPVIILGDFNSNWLASGSAIRRLAECGDVKVFKPEAENLGTYKSGKHRLDWVLLSGDLDFKRYEVLPDIVSDHQPILTEVTYNGNSHLNTKANSNTSSECDDRPGSVRESGLNE